MKRRTFLTHAGLAATGTMLSRSGKAQSASKNDEVTLAIAGINGQGSSHFRDFASVDGVRIKTVCDVDERVYSKTQKMAEELTGRPVEFQADIRRVLDDPEIDAISIATPNHWHSLMAVWACQAGKDVYVEKPVSHNVWEGRQAVEAARRYDRIVATGTQSRSASYVKKAVELLQNGVIGDVYMAKGLCYKPRKDIGTKADSPVPAGLDYNLWLGPAELRPFNENYVHYNWHWFWDFGNGDIGNQGVHEMDIARWGLNKKTLPTRIQSLGGYFAYNSAQQTPNTQLCTYEWDDGKILQFEVRGLMTNEEDGIAIGNLFYGTEGWMHLGDGFKTYLGRENEPGPSHEGDDENYRREHRRNFIEVVRSRRQEDLAADIQEGHLSSALCHLGNVAYRLERKLHFDPYSETFVNDPQADRYLTRNYRHPFVVPKVSDAVEQSG